MDASKIESGIELFQRTNKSQSSQEQLNLFPKGGPHMNNIVQISGPNGSGKTFILTNFIIKCLLPVEYKGIAVSGENCNVLFINTDHKFDLLRFVLILERYLVKNKPHCKQHVHGITKYCLKHLTIFNCYDNDQFVFTLLNLEQHLKNTLKTCVVAIDSLCPYYWSVKLLNKSTSYWSHFLSNLKLIKDVLKTWNAIFFYTISEEYSNNKNNVIQSVDYRLFVSRGDKNLFVVCCDSDTDCKTFKIGVNLNLENIIVG